MDSDEEVEDSEFNEDDEFEGYDELEKLSSDLEETKLNSQKRDSLMREKLNLLLKFNANAEDKYTSNGELIPGMLIDPELYRIEINKINNKILEIDELDQEVNEELAQNEIQFQTLLEEYIQKSKQGTKLTDLEIKKIKALQSVIGELRNQYSKVSKTLEPDSSLVYQFDDSGDLTNWEEIEETEMKEMKSIISRLKLHIKIPDEKYYKKKCGLSKIKQKYFYKPGDFEVYQYQIEFEKAYSSFMKQISPYLPNYITKMKITSIGEVTELSDSKSLLSQIKESAEEIKKLAIQLSESDVLEIEQLNEIKSKLKSLDKSKLIDCIQNSNIDFIDSYIQQLYNKKVPILKYQRGIITSSKEPVNFKDLLITLLINLGYSKDELVNYNKQELENILNEKYLIGPNLYFNKTFKYDTLMYDRKEILLKILR